MKYYYCASLSLHIPYADNLVDLDESLNCHSN